jgi:hypothetical protein
MIKNNKFVENRDVEARVLEKIRNLGVDAVYHFDQSEFLYYAQFVEPIVLLQVAANLRQNSKTVN